MHRLGTYAAAALLLLQPALAEVVNTASGPVTGVEANGIAAFKGIPYAAAPVGPLRWQPPQPPAPWSTPFKADAFGANCPQLVLPGDMAPLRGPNSEDCLTLNVWAPDRADKPLPVAVWIHGGGFVIGGTSPLRYDGSAFARDGVILVSINYRLGRFGFFAHPDMKGASGNFALMDMIAALRWVRSNIAAFGGDPARVTIFGESAGGLAVNILMNAPDARGLFSAAIAHSAGSGELPSLARAKKAGAKFGKGATLEALRQLPAEDIVGTLGLGSAGFAGPMLDGSLVPEHPIAAFKAKRSANIPYITGANSREMGFVPDDFATSAAGNAALRRLLARLGSRADLVRAHYPQEPGEAAVQIDSDIEMALPARQFARAHAQGHLYRFSCVAEKDKDRLPGAMHASEIPYVFDTADWAVTDTDRAAIANVHGSWVDFFKTQTAAWPRYESLESPIYDYCGGGTGPDARRQRLDVLEGPAPSLTSK